MLLQETIFFETDSLPNISLAYLISILSNIFSPEASKLWDEESV